MAKTFPPKYLVLYADDDLDELVLVHESFSNHVTNVELITVTDGVEAISYLESLLTGSWSLSDYIGYEYAFA